MASELIEDWNDLGGVSEAMTRDCTPDRWQGYTDEAVSVLGWVSAKRGISYAEVGPYAHHLIVRLQWSNAVQQFKIELRHQFVECMDPEVGADLVHDEIDGRSCLRSVLIDGGIDALLRGGNVHIQSTLSERTKQGLHLRNEIPPAIGPSGDRGIDAGLQDPFCFFRLLDSDQRAAQSQV